MVGIEFAPSSNMKPLHEAVVIARCEIAQALELLLSGSLRKVAMNNEIGGFDGLRVDPDELEILTRPEERGLWTIRKVLIRFSMDYKVTRKLIYHGYLTVSEAVNPLTRRRQHMVEPDSVAAFQMAFVSLLGHARPMKKGRPPSAGRPREKRCRRSNK